MIRIMIADDHDIVRQGLKLILEQDRGIIIVASCADGTDALNWLRVNDCDIVLLDIAMPGINGIDLLKRLRKEKPELPVLILSAYPEDQYAVRLIKAGAAGYLNKECGGCKNFCVNGHLAGNCLTLKRSEHDRSNEESPIAGSDRPTAG